MIDFKYYNELVSDTIGYTYSIEDKKKTLGKFGRTVNADSGVRTTVATFQGSVVNETFTTTNSVDALVSDNGANSGPVTIEGHSIDGEGNLTFRIQTVSLDGQTPVALSTPLARCTRIYRTPGTFASPAVELTGNVYVYDSARAGGASGGTPNDATATKCMIPDGFQQSQKCATSISQNDAWILTQITTGIERGGGGGSVSVDVTVEQRTLGGVWLPLGSFLTVTSASPEVNISADPAPIILPNSDVRLVAVSDTNNTTVEGNIRGYLAKRIGIPGI